MKHTSPKTRRDGAVLLVVLAMLALFAVIGLSFVFYAESRATAPRIYREAQAPLSDPDPLPLNAFSQLIYDNTDGPTGVFSGLRGHSLARAMYGMYSEPGMDPDNPVMQFNSNVVPYGGVGPVPSHSFGADPSVSPARPIPILNYMWKPGQLLYDPERTYVPNTPRTIVGTSDPRLPIDPVNSRYVGKNESVTYPTSGDVVVALVNPVNGNVLVPSLHRPWVFNGQSYQAGNDRQRQLALAPPGPGKPTSLDDTGDDWTNRLGRYRILRPRPIDHAGFPYPPANSDGTYTGDVQNLPGAAYPFLRTDGSIQTDANSNPFLIPKMDSVWVDTGAPVQIWNGKRVKPLYAFLVVPTNNRVNINSAGNLRGTDASGNAVNDSGMGLYPSEVNPKYAMQNQPANSYFHIEYKRLKTAQYGAPYTTPAQSFPYTPVAATPLPNPPGRTAATTLAPTGGYVPPASAAMDWDGTAPLNAMRMMLPGQAHVTTNVGQSAFATAPRFVGPTGQNRYGNGDVGDAVPVEQLQHPYFWNPYLHRSKTNATGGALTFTEADLRKLHAKWADDTGLTNDTLLGTLAPISFSAMKSNPALVPPYAGRGPGKSFANRDRFNLTTRSNSLALHNLMPMTANLGDMTPGTKYEWALTAPAPVGTMQQFPNPAGLFGNSVRHSTNPTTTDFDRTTDAGTIQFRAGVGALPPLDLNRPLTDYRHALAIKRGLPLRPDNVILPLVADYPLWCFNNGIATDATDAPFLATSPQQQTASLFAAMRDRQELAKDIFARLVVATGASASYMRWNGYCQPIPAIDVTLGVLPNPEYDALRYLAQLAVNIVDYIDGDDVATTFVWNPALPNVQSHFDPTNLLTSGLITPTSLPAPNDSNFNPLAIPNRVVMGTEKPKLVVNEAYCELANNAGESGTNRANRPLELRFILELMNPCANDALNGNETKPFHTATTFGTNPMANAVLYYNTTQQTPNAVFPAALPYSAYVVDLHVTGDAAIAEWAGNGLTVRQNVFGSNATVPARRIDFAAQYVAATGSPAAGYAGPTARTNAKSTLLAPEGTALFAGTVPPSPQFVAPVGTRYAPTLALGETHANRGYLVLAPGEVEQKAGGTYEYTPAEWNTGTMTYNLVGGGAFDSATMVRSEPIAATPTMGLTVPYPVGNAMPRDDNQIPLDVIQANAGRPAVLVRRLANPYLPANDPATATFLTTLPPNPYLVMDVCPGVKVNDGVRLGVHPTMPATMASNRPGATPSRAERISQTKTHPFVSLPTLTRPQALDVPPGMNPSGFPWQSLFRHNGTSDTDPEGVLVPTPTVPRVAMTPDPKLLMTPQGGGRLGFEWLVHMDRQLVNQLELLHVPAVPSHLLTLSFATGDINTPATLRFQNHVAAWTDSNIGNLPPIPPPPAIANQSRLYRALELLRVKPWNYAMPNGGRVPGKININLITDPNVLKALADPQNGDFFFENAGMTDPATGLPATDVLYDPVTPVGNTSVFGRLQTVRGGGAPVTSQQFNPATNLPTPTQIPSPNDRPFRSLGNAAFATGGYFRDGKGGLAETPLNGVFDLPSQSHPYVKNSLLRKVYNNLTTTSEVYEVYMTVGFFEVMNAGPYYQAPNWTTPILGKEIYKDVPTDLRHRFFAVVDRTNLSINPVNTGTALVPTTRQQGPKPVFTDLVGLSAPVPAPATGIPSYSTMQFHATAGFAGQGVTIQYDETPDQTSSFPITVGTRLKIGSGVNAEWVLVTSVAGTVLPLGGGTLFDTNTGIATVTVQRNTGVPGVQAALVVGTAVGQYPELPLHPVGSSITNVQLGNPGPQPAFDPTQPNYKAVMPYLIKLED